MQKEYDSANVKVGVLWKFSVGLIWRSALVWTTAASKKETVPRTTRSPAKDRTQSESPRRVNLVRLERKERFSSKAHARQAHSPAFFVKITPWLTNFLYYGKVSDSMRKTELRCHHRTSKNSNLEVSTRRSVGPRIHLNHLRLFNAHRKVATRAFLLFSCHGGWARTRVLKFSSTTL